MGNEHKTINEDKIYPKKEDDKSLHPKEKKENSQNKKQLLTD